jgi:hypothetical protein
VCKVKDADDLAEKLECIINMDNDKLQEMGRRSREKMVKEFSRKYVLPKYKNAVKDFLD